MTQEITSRDGALAAGSADIRRVATLTVTTLIGGLVVGVGVGAGIDGLVSRHSLIVGRTLAGIAALGIVFAAAMLWGRQLAQVAGVADLRHAGRVTALFVGLPAIMVGAGLAAIEPVAVRQGGQLGLSIHGVFTILFAFATLLITALGSYGLGRGLRDGRLGVRLAVRAGPAAAAGFVLVASTMYLLGWRVGAPRAAERATMLVVASLGLVAAAFVAGITIGYLLTTRPISERIA
jgi:hypothetical protein